MTKSASSQPQEFLSRDEERELARRWRDTADPAARDRILRAYHKLAVSFANRAARAGVSVDDLIQEANIGLMAALDRFDPDLGYAFATFAHYHVMSRLQIYILENATQVRIFNTAATKGLLRRYAQLRHELAAEGLDSDLRERLREELGVDDDQITRFEMAMAVPVSIDVGAGGDDTEAGSRSKTLESEDDGPDVQTLSKIAQEQAEEAIGDATAGLNEREMKILRARHLSDPGITLEALSAQLGISRERVRQIEIRTLEKVRTALKARGITSVSDLFG